MPCVNPEELKGLILMGTGARLRVHPDFLAQPGGAEQGNGEWLERQRSYFNGVESDIVNALIMRAREVGPDVERTDLMACDRFDVMQEVEGISLPTEIICGKEDEMTPVKYSNYLSERIKGSRKHIIHGAQHFVQLQQYQQVNQAIEKFLRRLNQKTSRH